MEQTRADVYRSYQGGYLKTIIAPEQTNNTLAMLEITLPKGAEPPPHIHTNEDETFYLLDGRISVQIADTTTILEPGEGIFAPRQVPHSFKILTENATIMNLMSPGDLWNYFIEFSIPISGNPGIINPPVTPSLDAIRQMVDVITNKYQVRFQ